MSIPELLQQLTLEEKASLCSGGDFWHTKAIERLGIPAMMMSDGPHGLRKQDETGDHMGINDSIKAVCFPAGCATASSFDRGLVERMGKGSGQRVSGGKCRRSAGAGSQHQAFASVRQKLRVLLGRSLRCR